MPYISRAPDIAVPIGGVLAWLKSFASTPALDLHYVECNGQVLRDANSVYNGATIPDLNTNTETRFLMGSDASGTTGGETTHTLSESEMPKHSHGLDDESSTVTAALGAKTIASGLNLRNTGTITAKDTTEDGGGLPHENRPKYYTVVWIMRVK